MREDKQAICNAFCETLRLTSAAGSPINNPLVELRYMTKEEGGRFDETAKYEWNTPSNSDPNQGWEYEEDEDEEDWC